MSALWLPAGAQRDNEVARETRLLQAQVYRAAQALEHYNRELQLIDPHLSVVLAKPTTTVEGLKGGYYHLVRQAPGSPAYIKPIEGPNGEWRDLDSSVLDLALEDDLWNDRTQRLRREHAEKREQAKQRDRDRAAQARAAEFDERWRSRNTTTIQVTKDIR